MCFQNIQFTVVLGSEYMHIVHCCCFWSLSFSPLPSCNSFFPIFIVVILLILACLWHVMFTFTEVIRFLYIEYLYSLISVSSSPHHLSLISWALFHLQEIHLFISFSPSLLYFLCTLHYSNKRHYAVCKLVCLIYFIQHYVFQVCPFSYKYHKFVLPFNWVVVYYIDHILFSKLSVYGYTGCFQDTALMHCAATNFGIHVSL